MNNEIAVLVSIGLVLILILCEMPVAFALMAAGGAGLLLIGKAGIAMQSLAATPYSAAAIYDYLILPFFILLGALVSNAGIAGKIFTAASHISGRLPGGLAIATLLACCAFGAISGSSAANAATIGRISVIEMRKHGYTARFAAGLVASAGTVAILIPPSIPLVIYGILTGLPIGTLLLAGIGPGICTIVIFAIYAMGHSMMTGQGLSRSDAIATEPVRRPPRRAIMDHPLIGMAYAGILFGIISGGIYGGLFTTTEAAACGVVAAFVIAIVVARSQGYKIDAIIQTSAQETADLTAMIFMLLIGTAIFTFFLAISRVPTDLAAWVLSLDISPSVLVALFLLALVPLGMFVDGLSMMLLTIPIAYPVFAKLGVDGIWLGILVVMLIEIGLITPPIGINVYVMAGLIDDLSVSEAFAGALPFLLVQFVVVALIFAFPEIVHFLPDLATEH